MNNLLFELRLREMSEMRKETNIKKRKEDEINYLYTPALVWSEPKYRNTNQTGPVQLEMKYCICKWKDDPNWPVRLVGFFLRPPPWLEC